MLGCGHDFPYEHHLAAVSAYGLRGDSVEVLFVFYHPWDYWRYRDVDMVSQH